MGIKEEVSRRTQRCQQGRGGSSVLIRLAKKKSNVQENVNLCENDEAVQYDGEDWCMPGFTSGEYRAVVVVCFDCRIFEGVDFKEFSGFNCRESIPGVCALLCGSLSRNSLIYLSIWI